MTIDKQKLKELAQAVADLEDIPEREDEHAEAVDALWLNVHCHTILALLAEIEQLETWRTAILGERSAHISQRDQLKAENEALRDGANFRAIQSLRADCEALRKDAGNWRVVERAMEQLKSDERGAAIWSVCSRILISIASDLNAARSVVTEEGVTKDGAEIGDWRVTVERLAMAKGASQ